MVATSVTLPLPEKPVGNPNQPILEIIDGRFKSRFKPLTYYKNLAPKISFEPKPPRPQFIFEDTNPKGELPNPSREDVALLKKALHLTRNQNWIDALREFSLMTLEPLDSGGIQVLPKEERRKAENLANLWEPWLNYHYSFQLSEKISLLLAPKKQTA